MVDPVKWLAISDSWSDFLSRFLTTEPPTGGKGGLIVEEGRAVFHTALCEVPCE